MSSRGQFALIGTVVLFMAAAKPTPFAREMLAAHNSVRARVGSPSLTWSAQLTSVAQDWANWLLAHREFKHRPLSQYGENLFEIINAKASPDEVVADWASEAKNYNYTANSCRGTCGHYTQIVWGRTREVGCAVARGGGREVWVCEYNPPGNFVGQRPY